MTQRKKSRVVLSLISFILFVAMISGCSQTAPAVSASAPTKAVEETQAPSPKLKKGLQTILVMGLDKFEREEETVGYTNHMQSDFLLLVVIDQNNHKMEALHINRDTMAKIPRIGVFGDAAGSFTGQLALAHTYGSGGSDSCLNAVKAVSNFLGGIKIDHYMTFTMDSVATINDAVGGVTVLVEDDFSEVDPTLVMGQEINLMGEHALIFVRGRHSVADMSNINRMNRQRQYMSALYGKIMEASAKDEDFVKRLVLKLSDSFMTDLTVFQMDTLSKTMAACTMEPFMTIEGEAVVGKEFMEFHADPDSVQAAVAHLFYE